MRSVFVLAVVLATSVGQLAQADCVADFVRDNQVKPAAGPYRAIQAIETQTRTGAEPLQPASAKTIIEEFVPNKALRSRSNNVLGAHETVAVQGVGGWTRAAPDAPWEAMADEEVKELARQRAFDLYEPSVQARNLRCLPTEKASNGRSLRRYQYEDQVGEVRTEVSIRFDAQSGLPVDKRVRSQLKLGRLETRSDIRVRYEFDRRIRIAAPAPQPQAADVAVSLAQH